MKKIIFIFFAFSLVSPAFATKLVSVSIIDRDYIMVCFRDGDVTFNEREIPGWSLHHSGAFSHSINQFVSHGLPLNVANVAVTAFWRVSSADDADFGTTGIAPAAVHRKSKPGCMAQMTWSTAANDYNYEWAYEHTVFLRLPRPLQAGKTYTVHIPPNINSDVFRKDVTFDIYNSRSEAIKVNIVGYSTANSIKSADVYLWMGDGGARDYCSFEGKNVYIYNVETNESFAAGVVTSWQPVAGETRHNHQMLRTDVWNVDFTGFNVPGNYRLVVEDIGSSDDFTIHGNIYHAPYKVSVQGFYYMRIGEANTDIVPLTRRPLYIPGVSPENCVVYITTLHPYHPDWPASGGDPWDNVTMWSAHRKPGNPTNPNAWGGHSDALDWDRHLGHVSIIYDMLLPYFVTNGAPAADDLHIAESANGIPDILDAARYEVDFWLRLRDGMGYSHGLNNPVSANNPTFYQAGTTAVAAWANAANAAMLAQCFRISGHVELMEMYRDSAIVAYNYASALPDQMLARIQNVGDMTMTGKDFRITAAAFLYNLTGEVRFEDDLYTYSICKTPATSVANHNTHCEIYAIAGYLFTNRTVNYPELYDNMKASLIGEAKAMETGYSNLRPSRRATDNDTGWFITTISVQRTIAAHALSPEGSDDRKLFEDALILEADFSLGRNPLNMINMTTATTVLSHKRSPENA